MEKLYLFLGLLFIAESYLALLYHSTNTDMGIIVGKIEDTAFRRRRSKVMVYLGIPYARSQPKSLRFEKPYVSKPFERPYNATYFRPACSNIVYGQANIRMSEDCLFLNIYAPIESTINPNRKYPVLVYLHGGEFTTGSSQDVSPDVLVFNGDVIVVTVNFRVGVFGFLSTGNEHMLGNYGLWDQHLAIKWVRFNIAAFGGDIERITLLGEGSGASSALLQAMYPGNRGHFQRVIAMSSGSLNPWALADPSAQKLGKKLGCIKDEDVNILNEYQMNIDLSDCLRNLPESDLLAASSKIQDIGPTIDGHFIRDHPYNILFPVNKTESDALNFYRSLDVIIGTNDQDGDKQLISILRSGLGLTDLDQMYIGKDEFEQVLLPTFLAPYFKHYSVINNLTLSLEVRNNVLYSTMFHYTNWTNPENAEYLRSNLLRLSSELTFSVPAIQFADAHASLNKNSSTFLYQFAHKPSYDNQGPVWVQGAGHGSEKLSIFGFPVAMTGSNQRLPENEFIIAENMMQWISNFAKTGNPNKPFLLFNDDSDWPLYKSDRKYLKIETNLSTHARFGEPSTSFWNTLVPVLLHSREKCSPEVTSPTKPTEEVYFTALQIPSNSVTVIITVLICVSVVLFALLVLVFVCLVKVFL